IRGGRECTTAERLQAQAPVDRAPITKRRRVSTGTTYRNRSALRAPRRAPTPLWPRAHSCVTASRSPPPSAILRSMRALLVFAGLLAACNGSAPTEKVGHGSAGSSASAAASTAIPASKAGPLVEGATVVRPHHEESVVECPAMIPDNADDEVRV